MLSQMHICTEVYLTRAMMSSIMASRSATATFHNEDHSYHHRQMPLSLMTSTTSDTKLAVPMCYNIWSYWNSIAITLLYVLKATEWIKSDKRQSDVTTKLFLNCSILCTLVEKNIFRFVLPTFEARCSWTVLNFGREKNSRQSHSTLLYYVQLKQ